MKAGAWHCDGGAAWAHDVKLACVNSTLAMAKTMIADALPMCVGMKMCW